MGNVVQLNYIIEGNKINTGTSDQGLIDYFNQITDSLEVDENGFFVLDSSPVDGYMSQFEEE